MWLNLFVVLFFMLELYKIKSNIDFPFDSLRIAHLWKPGFFFSLSVSLILCQSPLCVCVIVLFFLYNCHFTFDPSEVRALDAILHTQRNRESEQAWQMPSNRQIKHWRWMDIEWIWRKTERGQSLIFIIEFGLNHH